MALRSVMVSILLISGGTYLAFAVKSESVPIRRSLAELPLTIGQWQHAYTHQFDAEIVEESGVDDYTNRKYFTRAGAQIGLYIGYYQSQRQGDTIHSPLNCLPGAGWNPAEKGLLSILVPGGTSDNGGGPHTISINRIVIQKGAERQLVLYWYQSHGRVIASEYMGKIFTVLDAIKTNRTDAALVRVISPTTGTGVQEKEAEEAAVDFVKALFPLLSTYLPD